ncbi:MAG TPA: FadR/GntR family transcriptional regulator [Candidatus Sulfotelmatobacter sp.]|nr:FadR/GntR family transcriptional regulator [Candidatus Sulfotelmatobacter sp.]
MKTLAKQDASPTRFADQIYERVLQQIVAGEFKVGDRLPSENVLATEFDVSRAVVREALARLHADGVTIARRGAGTYVRRQPGREFLRLAPIGGIADLMRCFEFRIGLEGEAASLAAERRTDEHLAAIEEAFEALDRANSAGQLGVEEDIRFHAAIAAASRNALFIQTLDTLAAHIFNGMNVTRSLSLTRSRKRLALVQDEHRKILQAIREEDQDKARFAMREHISNARNRALGDSAEPTTEVVTQFEYGPETRPRELVE